MSEGLPCVACLIIHQHKEGRLPKLVLLENSMAVLPTPYPDRDESRNYDPVRAFANNIQLGKNWPRAAILALARWHRRWQNLHSRRAAFLVPAHRGCGGRLLLPVGRTGCQHSGAV